MPIAGQGFIVNPWHAHTTSVAVVVLSVCVCVCWVWMKGEKGREQRKKYNK